MKRSNVLVAFTASKMKFVFNENSKSLKLLGKFQNCRFPLKYAVLLPSEEGAGFCYFLKCQSKNNKNFEMYRKIVEPKNNIRILL